MSEVGPEAISIVQVRGEEGCEAPGMLLERGNGCWGPGRGQPMRRGGNKGGTSKQFAVSRVPGKMFMAMTESGNSERSDLGRGEERERKKHMFQLDRWSWNSWQ